MAKILQMFPGGFVTPSDTAAARMAESQRIRQLVSSQPYIHEIYGPGSQDRDDSDSNKLMETPDEVARTWGNGRYEIYDEMGRNVLPYRTAWDSRIDVLTGLQMVVLPGEKGNKDSEAAAEEIDSHWTNIDERMTAVKELMRMMELGFSVGENVWDVQARGKSKGQFGIVEIIPRPVSWFGFTPKGAPKFKDGRYLNDPAAVPDYKCTWGRYGSLHSRYGRGGGQDCYPTVWTIDRYLKNHHEAVERAGWIPVLVTYPDDKATWPQGRVDALIRHMKRQWKNVVCVPGEVAEVKVNELTGHAYSNANATGAERMEVVTMLVSFLRMQVQGMENTSSTGTGSFAKETVVDNAKMYKAPGDAAALEAMLNRCFVRPIMLANRPALDESLWPRFAIDASFGEDIAQLLLVMEAGVKMGVKIETVTFCDRFKIKGADLENNPDAELLTIQQAPTIAIPGAPEPVEAPDPPADAIARVARGFGEHGGLIDFALDDGTHAYFDPGQPVYTENRGLVARAALCQSGDIPLLPAAMVRSA